MTQKECGFVTYQFEVEHTIIWTLCPPWHAWYVLYVALCHTSKHAAKNKC